MRMVDETLFQETAASHPLLQQAARHLVLAGGKRIRPTFLLLSGKIVDPTITGLVPLAGAMELIHIASLVHDDVIDASTTRRGVPTVTALWGNQVSVHAGDYLFARSLMLVAKYNNPRLLMLMAEVSYGMSEGEIQQILSAFDVDQSIKSYLSRIRRKTALLISASCALGAIANQASETMIRTLTRFGHFLGMAFQIRDDILDLTSDETTLGKPVASDLAQGIITLPVIFALQASGGETLRRKILLLQNDEIPVTEILPLICQPTYLESANQLAEQYILKARREIDRLPASPAADALVELSEFMIARNY